MHFWAELGPKNHRYSLCYGRISAPGRKSALLMQKIANSRNSVEFRGISGKARRRSARKWKGWFGAIQVSISGGDFHIQKRKFAWFSWKRRAFHEFHEISSFSQKTALLPPKPSIFRGLWKDFRPGPEKCAFWQKVALFALFQTFRENTHFHDFQDFGISHWKTLIWRYTGGRFF